MKSLLPQDAIEDILERLPVKTLLKFKCVSKQWKSTIESLYFEKRQMFHRKQSGDPDVLFVSVYPYDSNNIESDLRTLELGSLDSAKIPTPWDDKFYLVCKNSCDGLICLYYLHSPCIVLNPATRWYRTFPRSTYYQIAGSGRLNGLGFGKDKINGTYKPVWLYNSDEVGLNNSATTCEVFDFTTNAWRFVAPASPYSIRDKQEPVYVDGSLHWFTAWRGEILSFDLHTETFQVISKVPFQYYYGLSMCNLDDRLCVFDQRSVDRGIWSFDSHYKTWKKIYSIEHKMAHSWFGRCMLKFEPLAIVDKDKLLYHDHRSRGTVFVAHDPKTKSYDLAYKFSFFAFAVCYFPSLFTIL